MELYNISHVCFDLVGEEPESSIVVTDAYHLDEARSAWIVRICWWRL